MWPHAIMRRARRRDRSSWRAAPARRRRQRDERQDRSDRREHDRIGRADAEQLALEAPAQRDDANGAEHESTGNQHGALAQHQLEDRAGAAPERDADADLLGPLRHQIRQDAVDADRRQQQRHDAEAERQQDRRAARRQRPLRPVLHRLRVEHGQFAIDAVDRAAHFVGEGVRDRPRS